MNDVKIEKYAPEHRDAVHRICFDTGFGGDSMAPFFDDAALFGDVLVSYYTDYIPEHAWVLTSGGETVGYFLGCLDSASCNETTTREIYPRIMRSLLAGKYNLGGRTLGYVTRSIEALMTDELRTAPLELYPAHLHVNLLPDFRRGGIGRRLIDMYIEYLRERDVPGLHLGTSTVHRRGVPFYRKLGFHEYLRTRSAMWKGILDYDVYNIVFVKEVK